MKRTEILEKRIFALLYLITVPIYTFTFGLIKNPIDFTLSQIGYLLRYRTPFIIWGIITGFLLMAYITSIYKRAQFFSRPANIMLALSFVFLVITVLVPAAKYTNKFMFTVHLISAALFVTCVLMSLILFARHICKNTVISNRLPIMLMAFCIAVPLTVLIAYGKLTGIAEMTFFACVTAVLIVADIKLLRLKKAYNK
jgi:hypothetical protein